MKSYRLLCENRESGCLFTVQAYNLEGATKTIHRHQSTCKHKTHKTKETKQKEKSHG